MSTTDERIEELKLELFRIIADIVYAENFADWNSIAISLKHLTDSAFIISSRLE